MNSFGALASFLTCTWLTWYISGQFVTFAFERRLVDIPNQRSSHSRITPRGGGISFAIVFLTAVVLLGVLQGMPIHLPTHSMLALLGGAGIAAVGYLDDCRGLSVGSRLAVQLALTTLTLFLICGNPFATFHYSPALVAVASLGAVVTYTWLINLVNFMDGIDGLAASGTICVSGSCYLLLLMRHQSNDLALLFGLLACAVLGFLFWNWPNAHIFMGDVGSCFIGFTIGALALMAVLRKELGPWVVPILMGVFVVDASATVLRRMTRGEHWYKPHRLHGFQHAADAFGHRNVTISVMIVDVFWLLPLAFLADAHPRYGFPLLLFAWAPIVLLSYLFHSGEVLNQGAIPRWRSLALIVHCTPERIREYFSIHATRLTPRRLSLIRGTLLALLSLASTYLSFATTTDTFLRFLSARATLLLGLFCITQLSACLLLGAHRYHWHLISLEEIPNVIGMCLAATFAGAITGMAVSPANTDPFPLSFFVVQMICFTALLVASRVVAASLARPRHTSAKPPSAKRVIIYGANYAGLEVFTNVHRSGTDYRVVGFVDPRTSMTGIPIAFGKVLGVDSEIARIAKTYSIDDVLISSSTARSPAGRRFLQRCRDAAVDVHIVPSFESDMNFSNEVEPVRVPRLS